MDIRNSKEIIKDILGRYSFSSRYFENGFGWELGLANFYGEPKAAIDFLLASAFTGNKVIGFFKQVPIFSISRFIRGECIFIAENLPEKMTIPTLFCRDSKNFANIFSCALKTSQESKLPVLIVIAPNAINGFANFEKPTIDQARTSPYIYIDSVHEVVTEDSMAANLKVAENVLAAEYPQKPFENSYISFNDPEAEYFNYFIPGRPPEIVKSLKNKKISMPEDEAVALYEFVLSNFGIRLQIESLENSKVCETKEFLCPGCPFVNIFIKSNLENKVVFTNISCEGLFAAYKPIFATIDTYAGMLSNGLNVETLFIGSASSYKPYYDDFIKNGRVVFLNNCGISGINNCSSIRHPKKFQKDKNTLYPFGCFNIKKYPKLSVKTKKCLCVEKNEPCDCMEKTKCPAIFISNGHASIDANLCVGCHACKAVCKFGAIS